MSFCPRVKVFARMPQKFWPRFFKMLANLPMASRLSLSCRPSGLHFAMQNRQTYRVRAAPAKRRFLLRAFLFAPMVSKRKAAMKSKPNNSSFSLYHFRILLSTTKKKKKRNDPKIIAYFLPPRWVRTWRWVGNYLLSALSFLVNWLFL